MAVKVAIDAGHGGFGVTPGKRTPDGEYEWNFNDKVASAAIKYLKKYKGVKILRTDDSTGKTDVPLTTRTNKANSWGADIFISCHHNANTGSWGDWTGTETYTYIGNFKDAERLAKLAQKHVVKAYGLKNRGTKKADFHVLRETKMPAILIEGGYMDSRIDIKKLRDNSVLDKAGKAVAEAVAEYFGLKKSADKPKTSKPSKPTSKPSKKPSFKVGSKVTLSKSAKKYATGETIPAYVKGKKYTIQQVKSDRVLLKELYSWVKKSDVSGASKPADKPKKPAKKPSSKSGKYGKLKITSNSGTAIVMAKPDRISAKNLGTVSGTVPLNGSVRGKNSSSGYWEIEYKGGLGYVTGNLGKRV